MVFKIVVFHLTLLSTWARHVNGVEAFIIFISEVNLGLLRRKRHGTKRGDCCCLVQVLCIGLVLKEGSCEQEKKLNICNFGFLFGVYACFALPSHEAF